MVKKSLIRSGRTTLYAKPETGKEVAQRVLDHRDRWVGMRQPLYNEARKQEEENILLRKIKEDKAVLDLALAKATDEALDVNEIDSDEDDVFMRSQCFYKLNDLLDHLDAQEEFVNPARKKLIMHKLNKLSRRDLISRSQVDERAKEFSGKQHEIELALFDSAQLEN